MASEWFACKDVCTGADPTSDTVRVDAALLAAEKENVKPSQTPQMSAAEAHAAQKNEQKLEEERVRQMQKEDERRQVEEQANRRRAEEEAKRQRDEQLAVERVAAERSAAAAAAEAAAAAAAQASQEQLRLDTARAAEEKARQEREAVEEARRLEDERQAQAKVAAWCKKNGFNDMSSKKSSCMGGAKFPLHEAVAQKDSEMLALMVQLGADRGVINSKGQTPEALAVKMNKNGSMDGVLAKLKNSQA